MQAVAQKGCMLKIFVAFFKMQIHFQSWRAVSTFPCGCLSHGELMAFKSLTRPPHRTHTPNTIHAINTRFQPPTPPLVIVCVLECKFSGLITLWKTDFGGALVAWGSKTNCWLGVGRVLKCIL